MTKEENKDLAYWKANAEEDYMQVPISVLRYITELETVVKNCSIPAVMGELTCDSCGCHPSVIYTTSKGKFCKMCKPAS